MARNRCHGKFELRASERCGDRRTTEFEPGHEYLLHHQGGFFAGRHLLVDIWNGENLSNIDVVDAALRRGAEDRVPPCCMSIYMNFQRMAAFPVWRFSRNRTQASIHGRSVSYAAVDLFMCGETDPMKGAEILREAFKPGRLEISDHYRGRIR